MSGWERTHRRYRLVYAVAEDVVRRGPEAITTWRPEIVAEFGGMRAFLLDVRRRWHLAVEAHIDDMVGQDVVATAAEANRPLWALWSALSGDGLPVGVPRAAVQPA